MEERLTVTDLQNTNQLKFFRGRYNILDCGVRTGKTYWAVNNLTQFTRDGKLSRILFLTDTTALKAAIIEQYGESCQEVNDLWYGSADDNFSIENDNKIGIMCYQAFGMKLMREEKEFLDSIDVICWDECDSIFDFASQAFTRALKYDFARKQVSRAEILNIIQEYSSKKDYMPLVLLGQWERIINEQRILCIGLSATPERAQQYYKGLTTAAFEGKIEAGFRAAQDIYFKNIFDLLDQLTPLPGTGYWCLSPSIKNNQAIVEKARQRGFKPIEIHSLTNTDYVTTEEQKRVYNCIHEYKVVPLEYDFVVVTRAYERGIDILDTRFKNLVVDSYYRSDRIQAARQLFPYQRYVKVLTEEVPASFKNRWLSADECRELAEYMNVPDINLKSDNTNKSHLGQNMSWNKLQEILPAFGYTIEKSRKRLSGKKNPVVAYYISGEWKDAEVVKDNEFLRLLDAKNSDETIEIE